MNVESLYAEASRRADDRFDEILVRLLTADLPEPLPDPSCPCAKCTRLIRDYVTTKLALHRYGRRSEFYGRWLEREETPCEDDGRPSALGMLRMRMEQARSAFRSASCECGQYLWKGRRWHDRQAALRLQAVANH